MVEDFTPPTIGGLTMTLQQCMTAIQHAVGLDFVLTLVLRHKVDPYAYMVLSKEDDYDDPIQVLAMAMLEKAAEAGVFPAANDEKD